ncbi:MAG: universal stress protein [Bacillota bacterium]|nr:universal stress protein [Bacillota bacterium]
MSFLEEHLAGILIALAIGLLTTLNFVWMSRVPRPIPRALAEAEGRVGGSRRIVVFLDPYRPEPSAVAVAHRLAAATEAEIVLAALVRIPFTRSLSVPPAQQETIERGLLAELAEGLRSLELRPATRVVPSRQYWDGAKEFARRLGADIAVIGVGEESAFERGEVLEGLLRELPLVGCEVIIIRPRATERSREQQEAEVL